MPETNSHENSEEASNSPGRIMALDLGEKRIGVALSDETGSIARSHAVFKRTSRQADFDVIGRYVRQEGVKLLVVGLPRLLSGEEGSKALWVRDYAGELGQVINLPIVFWDESYSTRDAEESLRARGIHGRKRRKRVDAVAAAFILQSYLDDLRSRNEEALNG